MRPAEHLVSSQEAHHESRSQQDLFVICGTSTNHPTPIRQQFHSSDNLPFSRTLLLPVLHKQGIRVQRAERMGWVGVGGVIGSRALLPYCFFLFFGSVFLAPLVGSCARCACLIQR